MINYVEKGRYLHEAIRAAGHSLRQENGVWVSSDDKAVQAIIDGYTVEQAAREKKAAISAYATSMRNRVVSGYSPGELASWALKLGEAKAHQAGQASTTPILSIEASMRGVSLEELVQRVLQNGEMFSMAEAAIAGREGFHRDAVDKCQTFDEVTAYDFSAGWPDL